MSEVVYYITPTFVRIKLELEMLLMKFAGSR